jgi:hypothetical protein
MYHILEEPIDLTTVFTGIGPEFRAFLVFSGAGE